VYLYQYFLVWLAEKTGGRCPDHLGMIRIDVQVGKQERFIARLVAPAIWLDGDKNSINLRQRLGIVEP
jgi:hypothetical protein